MKLCYMAAVVQRTTILTSSYWISQNITWENFDLTYRRERNYAFGGLTLTWRSHWRKAWSLFSAVVPGLQLNSEVCIIGGGNRLVQECWNNRMIFLQLSVQLTGGKKAGSKFLVSLKAT